ncbi:MAG: septation protein SpoVG family protein [Pirellulaceae bacterium]|nr:septation protein SpoVG family protein [Pirellulaceae bacterium]
MKVTEVRIKLTGDTENRLLAFCSVTLDDSFVVRDLKVIEGGSGMFVAMPSRKLTGHCPGCRGKNHLRSNFCNQCGQKLCLDSAHPKLDTDNRLYADIAHPINSQCREMIQKSVIEEFHQELTRSKQPGYQPRHDMELEGVDYSDPTAPTHSKSTGTSVTPSDEAQSGTRQLDPVDPSTAEGSNEPSDHAHPANVRQDANHQMKAPSGRLSPVETEKPSHRESKGNQFGAGILD